MAKQITEILKTLCTLTILLGILSAGKATQTKEKKLILKTCEGCALAHYPNIVKFIKYDLPRFNKHSV
jgi:alkyl hydroperoxide reductase subunit AhpF